MERNSKHPPHQTLIPSWAVIDKSNKHLLSCIKYSVLFREVYINLRQVQQFFHVGAPPQYNGPILWPPGSYLFIYFLKL